MPLTRQLHWATRGLHGFLRRRDPAPFAWGTNDCCLFAANAILAFTGTDIAADFRGKYTDKASAFALIKTLTGGSTVTDAAAYCAQKHGLIEWQHPLLAQRGDLVVIANAGALGVDSLIAGIVHLSGRHVISIAESGPVKIPVTSTLIKRAWHV